MGITQKRIFRLKWSSEKTFILSTIAAVVGLGNLWRFPYIAGENGGASFILAYLISVIVLGIPLMIMEIGTGKLKRGGPIKVFQEIGGKTRHFGWLIIGLTVLIMSYYLVITGWCLNYAIKSLFKNTPNFEIFTSSLEPLLFFIIVFFITAFVVAKGVRIIEKINVYLMPILILIILLLTIYSLSLSGASQAISFLFKPDLSSFLVPSIWVLAFGQAFYSLAIGQGYLLTYGSFLPEKTNITKSVSTIAIIETSIALIAGLMMFPLIFTFGLNPAEGPELAFKTLPLAFANIPFNFIIAIAFFWLFFLAALSSCIAGMEVVKTAIREELKLTHNWATTASFLLVLPLGILSALSFTSMGFEINGISFLKLLDIFTANQLVILLGILGGTIISWKIHPQDLVNMFGNKYRLFASYIIKIMRYLWIFILFVLFISFAF